MIKILFICHVAYKIIHKKFEFSTCNGYNEYQIINTRKRAGVRIASSLKQLCSMFMMR